MLNNIQPVFVLVVPKKLEDGKLYIMLENDMAIHNCCCGCKTEIVTRFSSDKWHFSYMKKKVSLYPAIDNVHSICRSHYLILNNQIEWY